MPFEFNLSKFKNMTYTNKIFVEIDLSSLSKQEKHYEYVTVHLRNGKTFKRKQLVGKKGRLKKETKRDLEPPQDKIIREIGKFKWYFKNVDPTTGKVAYETAKEERLVPMQVSGDRLINKETGKHLTIPQNLYKRKKQGLDGFWIGSWLVPGEGDWERPYERDLKGQDEYEKQMEWIRSGGLDSYKPDYEPVKSSEYESKYAKSMNLIRASNPVMDINSNVPSMWYLGQVKKMAIANVAIHEIMEGKFDPNNIFHPGLKPIIEASKIIASKYGSDKIYRGETSTVLAHKIINALVEDGEFMLPDKLSSWTENEKLGRWYASVHEQEAPEGYATKTNIMIRLDKARYEPNVALDYRVCQQEEHGEQEITISGKNIKITSEDVFTFIVLPGQKKKRWVSIAEFLKSGGTSEELHANVQKGEKWRQ